MKKYLPCNKLLLLVFLLTTSFNLFAQDSTQKKKEIDELKLNLNADGSHFLKFTLLGQIWIRYNESNPGTTVLKEPKSETFDIGIHRFRASFFGQITDHAFFFVHIGQDNFNYLSARKYTPFIQDALGEYRVKKGGESLVLGTGLTATSGFSRFTQPQLANIMSMDIPVFALPAFDLTDQFGRRLSLYARGQISKLDYRVILSDPFPVTTNPGTTQVNNPVSPNSSFAQHGNHYQYHGLFMWNFFDREPHILGYMPGTYYGKKKVLNLEAGFFTQKNATWSSNDSGATVNYHPLNCWSVAAYYDAPVNKGKGTAINTYLGYFETNYGPGYVRYIGVMDPADGLIASANYVPGSQGNAFPVYGTGHTIYSQFGFLCRKNLFGNNSGTLMPYATMQTSKYDRLDKAMTVFNLGINWALKGNTNKITFDYQNRPTYTLSANNLMRSSSRKGQFVLQYQFFLL